MKKACFAIWIVCLTALVGCGQQGESLVVTSGSRNLEDTSADYYATNDRIFLVVWHDLARSLSSADGHGGSSCTSNATETIIEGNYQTTSGSSLQYICHTSDGNTGSVVIDGAEFDLADGGVFLVKASQGIPSVEQLDRELPRSKAIGEIFETLANSDHQIKEFLGVGGGLE